jgi:hypothetical protein
MRTSRAGTLLLLSVVGGCCTLKAPSEPYPVAEIRKVQRAVDFLDKWGSLSVSGAVLAADPEAFKFDPGVKPEALYQNNFRAQGAVATGESSSVRLGASVAVAPAGGGAPVAEAPESVPESSAAKDVGRLADLPGISGSAPVVSQRRVIRQTASDNFELSLHKVLSGDVKLPEDTALAYLIFNVSCEPGQLSREGYTGELALSLPGFVDDNGRPLGSVIGLYPAFDSQELDLSSADRQLRAIALQLAAAGKVLGANAMIDAANRLERSARTMSSEVVVSSFHRGPYEFGYLFRPSFVAQDPEAARPRSVSRLGPVTFPAVAIVAVSKQTLDMQTLRLLQDDRESAQLIERFSAQQAPPRKQGDPESVRPKPTADELREFSKRERLRSAASLRAGYRWIPESRSGQAEVFSLAEVYSVMVDLKSSKLATPEQPAGSLTDDASIRLVVAARDTALSRLAPSVVPTSVDVFAERFRAREVELASVEVLRAERDQPTKAAVDAAQTHPPQLTALNAFYDRPHVLVLEGKHLDLVESVDLVTPTGVHSISKTSGVAASDSCMVVIVDQAHSLAILDRPFVVVARGADKLVLAQRVAQFDPPSAPSPRLTVKLERELGLVKSIEIPLGKDGKPKPGIDRVLELLKAAGQPTFVAPLLPPSPTGGGDPAKPPLGGAPKP